MKILSYQATPVFGDLAANLATVESVCAAAASFRIDVAVFPELFLTGYNLGDRARSLSISSTGSHLARIRDIAAACGVAIVIGFPELDGGTLYNSAVAVDAQGRLAGRHRKVYLFGDREKATYTPGTGFDTFSIAGHTCALSICYDIEFPEVSRDLKRRGAEVIFVPTANMAPYFDVPTILARSRALENGLAIVYANLCGVEGDHSYTGLSAIIAPDGKDVARAGMSEAVLICELPLHPRHFGSGQLSTQISDLELS